MTDRDNQMVDLAQQASEPVWLSSMREYHETTGIYRQEDIFRLLGAPWERVEISLSADGVAASCVRG